MRMIHAFAVALACSVAIGCGDDNPLAPSASDVSGTWSGSITSGSSKPPMRLTLQQRSNTEVTGTWASENPDGGVGGSLGGTVNGAVINVSMYDQQQGTCRMDLTAKMSGTSLTGTYTTVNCAAPGAGSVDLTKK